VGYASAVRPKAPKDRVDTLLKFGPFYTKSFNANPVGTPISMASIPAATFGVSHLDVPTQLLADKYGAIFFKNQGAA
jgi:hypothetical protein